MARFVWTVLLLLALGVGLLVVSMPWLEPLLTYHPVPFAGHTPAEAGLDYRDVRLRTADGETLHGWWIPAARSDLPVLLFFHGNAGNREHRLHNLAGLHAAGISVLIFDYRGYGGSTGRPSEAGLIRDGEAAFDWLRAEVGDRPIVIFGRSLGGAVAARVALSRPPAGLILESTFTRAPDMAGRVLPLPGVRYLVRSRFDALAAVQTLRMPLLLIHGERDEIVPFAMGRRLLEAAVALDKTFHAVPGAHHNNTYVAAGPAYWQWLRGFLERVARRAG